MRPSDLEPVTSNMSAPPRRKRAAETSGQCPELELAVMIISKVRAKWFVTVSKNIKQAARPSMIDYADKYPTHCHVYSL